MVLRSSTERCGPRLKEFLRLIQHTISRIEKLLILLQRKNKDFNSLAKHLSWAVTAGENHKCYKHRPIKFFKHIKQIRCQQGGVQEHVYYKKKFFALMKENYFNVQTNSLLFENES